MTVRALTVQYAMFDLPAFMLTLVDGLTTSYINIADEDPRDGDYPAPSQSVGATLRCRFCNVL